MIIDFLKKLFMKSKSERGWPTELEFIVYTGIDDCVSTIETILKS